MRSEVPDGDLAAVIDKAVTRELERREARRFAKARSPRTQSAPTDPGTRYVAAAVRRAVFRRDGGRCCFADAQARRCPERHRLEFHHRYPFGRGGSRGPDNIFLMCRAHNQYLAEIDYGRNTMSRHRIRATESQGGKPSGALRE